MKVLIIDDHKLFAEGIKQVFIRLYQDIQITTAATLKDGLEKAFEISPDLILYDYYLPDSLGIESVQDIRRIVKSSPIIIVSACEDRTLVKKLAVLGVSGFVGKSSSLHDFRRAIQTVMNNGTYFPAFIDESCEDESNTDFALPLKRQLVKKFRLTQRQITVLSLIVRGRTNKEIGEQLGCAEGTIKVHVSSILRAMSAKNRTEAIWIVENIKNENIGVASKWINAS